MIARLSRCNVARGVCMDGFERLIILPGCRELLHSRFEQAFPRGLYGSDHLVLKTVECSSVCDGSENLD